MKTGQADRRFMVLCLFALALLLALAVLLFSYILVLHTNDADDGNFFADYPWVLVVLTVVATGTALLPVAAISLLRRRVNRRRRVRFSRGRPAGEDGLWHKMTTSPPAFTHSEAEAWMADIIPLVEEVAGARLEKLPELKLVNWREVGRVLARDLLLPHAGGEGPAGGPVHGVDRDADHPAFGTVCDRQIRRQQFHTLSVATEHVRSDGTRRAGPFGGGARCQADLGPTNLFMPCRTNA